MDILYCKQTMKNIKLIKTDLYLLLIDEEAEICQMDLYLDVDCGAVTRATLTSDQYEGCKKVIAYYPLTDEAKELDLPLLPNPFEEIDIEDLSEKANGYAYYGKPLGEKYLAFKEGFIEGYKAAQSKQFSLEDMLAFGKKCFYKGFDKSENDDANSFTAWREECSELIQSLSTQRLPKEFIPEYDLMNEGYNKPEDYPYQECKVLKTITNSKGKQELVGTYKY